MGAGHREIRGANEEQDAGEFRALSLEVPGSRFRTIRGGGRHEDDGGRGGDRGDEVLHYSALLMARPGSRP